MATTLKITGQNEEDKRHQADIQSLLYHNGKIYSGAEDGKIKVWNAADLKYIDEIQAHENCVYSLAAIGDDLYSSANDGTVKCWDLNLMLPKSTIHSGDASVEKLFVDGKRLYAGDESGFIGIYENNHLVNHLNVVEEVKDIVASGKYVYSVRSLDITVTELLDAGDGKFLIKTQFEGAAPMALVNGKLCVCTRDGKNVTVHNLSDSGMPKLFCTITASEMIVTSLAAIQLGDQSILYSGGWDKTIKRWIISGDKPVASACAIVPTIIYAVCVGPEGQAYVGGTSGMICRLDLS